MTAGRGGSRWPYDYETAVATSIGDTMTERERRKNPAEEEAEIREQRPTPTVAPPEEGEGVLEGPPFARPPEPDRGNPPG